MAHWIDNTLFYHIYPLGFCGAPDRNDFSSPPTPRLDKIETWLDHIQGLGANALYLGPLFESTAHGYDTADYYTIDRRLGQPENLIRLSHNLHQRGMKLVLDGVFNHVGRDFWAFRDVLAHGADSPYASWFHLDFSRHSPAGDPFAYQGWNGFYDLVKLNSQEPAVRAHLLNAVAQWIERYDPDGLRLDAAEVMDTDFLRALGAFCRARKPDFWLMGEVVLADYRPFLSAGLDSVTNYEIYKSLYSSHNDHNYFEIAYALNRQSGASGIYKGHTLYTFADNHDVNRVASTLANPAHLYPLYGLLFTIPGVPSIYYGSEWGLAGQKHAGSDLPLRPNLSLATAPAQGLQPQLADTIARLAAIRRRSPALTLGDYTQLHVASQQLAFARRHADQTVIVAANAALQGVDLEITPPVSSARWVDLLNPGEEFRPANGKLKLPLNPCWLRILKNA